jgi:hypothetical protein
VIDGVPELGLVAADLVLEDVSVRNVECAEQAAGGVFVMSGGTATLRSTAIERICGRGIFAEERNVRIRASDVVVRRTLAPVGRDILLQAGSAIDLGSGEVVLERALLEDASGSPAVFLSADPGQRISATLDDVLIRRSAGPGRNGYEMGLYLDFMTELTARRLHFEDVYGLAVRGGAGAVLSDVTVHWSSPQPLELLEGGISCTGGGSITAERVLVERARAPFLVDLFEGTGCRTTISDFASRDTVLGLWMESSSVDVTRARVERTVRAGIGVIGGDARMSDLDVDGVEVPAGFPGARETWGDGVLLLDPAGVVSRVRVRGHQRLGVRVDHRGAGLSLEDLDIGDGRAAGVVATGAVALRRVLVDRATLVGLFVGTDAASPPASVVTAEDVLVRDTSGNPEGLGGMGVAVYFSDGFEGSRLTLTRALIERNREVGLVAAEGAVLEARQVRVADTLERACADGPCAGEPGGHGLGVYNARIDLADVTVEGSPLCGLHALPRRNISIARVRLRRNVIGLCADTQEVVDAIRGHVLFEDNVRDSDAGDFYVPPPPSI